MVTAVSVVSVGIVGIPICLAPATAMGAARATHRPVWWYPVLSLGVDTDTTSHSDEPSRLPACQCDATTPTDTLSGDNRLESMSCIAYRTGAYRTVK